MKAVLLCSLTLAAALHGGERVPAQIPPAAKWQVHADLDAMRDSETGKTLIAAIEADHGARLRAFKRMFSIHPINDLHGVTLYGDGKPDHAVALIDGTFDRAHLEDIILAADDHASSTHAGFTVHSWKDKGETQHAAFATDTLVVFSRQRSMLDLALDTLKAGAPAEADPFFTRDGGRPLVAASGRLSEMEMPGDEARVLRMADTLRLAADEHEGRFIFRAGIDARSTADADRLRRILDGIAAFAQIAEPKLDGLDLRADFSLDATRLDAALSLPVAEWISLVGKFAADEARKTGDED